ncbi:unnamed protein product, partial [Mesorhabditis belari]|uniref:Small ribosomal subunit protein mS39 n=1 Tax=Mesorhabditis belari TaxID=2138241 RepID=A0AAF3EJT6_9BILA
MNIYDGVGKKFETTVKLAEDAPYVASNLIAGNHYLLVGYPDEIKKDAPPKPSFLPGVIANEDWMKNGDFAGTSEEIPGFYGVLPTRNMASFSDCVLKRLNVTNSSWTIDGMCIALYREIRKECTKSKDLFFLLAYYGGENVPFYEELEWHGLGTFGEADPPKWKDDVISLLYESIEQTPEVKSAMICGIIKHTQSTEKANQLFQGILSSGATPCVEAFNTLIAKSQFSVSLKLLQKMKHLSVKPDVNTFNALLESNMTAPLDNRQKTARKNLGEMKLLKIHPTLFILLNGIVKIRTRDVDNKDYKPKEDDLKLAITALNEIMTRMVVKRMSQTPSTIITFFSLPCQYKVVQFYESPNNKVKAPEFTFEDSFYNKYLQLFIDTTGDLKEIERVYKEYVPNRVGVSHFLIIRLINRLKTIGHFEFNKKDRNRLQQKLNPSTLIECACLLAKIGEDKKAFDLLQLLVEEEGVKENEVPKEEVQEGQLKIGLVKELFDHALRQKNTDFTAFIFEIMSRDMPRAQLKLQAQQMTERCRPF